SEIKEALQNTYGNIKLVYDSYKELQVNSF
ncbi:MAG: hypothetical protein ACJAQX_001514, partial [Polaribacter sp.]